MTMKKCNEILVEMFKSEGLWVRWRRTAAYLALVWWDADRRYAAAELSLAHVTPCAPTH